MERTSRVSRGTLAFVVLLFVLLKGPMLFLPTNADESIELDAGTRVARGEVPYRDFTYLYGPLSPWIHGLVGKVAPANLLTLRLTSLALWCAGVAFVALVLARFLGTPWALAAGTLAATAQFGQYPTYSHCHVIATVGALMSLHFLVEISFGAVSSSAFVGSFLGALIALLSRPVVFGYGAIVAWAFLIASNGGLERARRARIVCAGLAAALLAVGLSYLAIGPTARYAFFPNLKAFTVWGVGPSPVESLRSSLGEIARGVGGIGSLFRAGAGGHELVWQLRKQLEPIAFLVMMGWTAVLLGLWAKERFRIRGPFAAFGLCLVFWVATSGVDTAHYLLSGFYSRSMFYGCFLLVPLAATALGARQRRFGSGPVRAASAAALALLVFWGYLPTLVGAGRLARRDFNPYGFPVLKGIASQPGSDGILRAIAFVNERCRPGEDVAKLFYFPPMPYLLRCEEVFSRDSHLFNRAELPFLPGETPLAPAGGETPGQVVSRLLRERAPRFQMRLGGQAPAGEGWQRETFPWDFAPITVFWKAEPTRDLSHSAR